MAGIKRFRKSQRRNVAKTVVAIAFLILLTSHSIWACTTIAYGFKNKTRPYTGPELPGVLDVVIPQTDEGYSNLTKLLLSKRQNQKYLVAASRSVNAGPIILETGYPVIAYGGF